MSDNLDLLENIQHFIRENDKSVIACFDGKNINLFWGAEGSLDDFFKELFKEFKKGMAMFMAPGETYDVIKDSLEEVFSDKEEGENS